MLDPESPAFEDEAIAREVLTSLTESRDHDQLTEFFQEFANITERVTTYTEDCHILIPFISTWMRHQARFHFQMMMSERRVVSPS